MIESAPFVSMVIPTHNRGAMLRQMLEEIAKQTYPAQLLQVLVVADDCVDGTVEMLSQYRAPFTLHVLEQPSGGAARARNAGAARATGSLLLFLDDDIKPTPGLVEAHVRAHQAERGRIVIGYCPPVISGSASFFGITLRSSWNDMFHEMRQSGHRFTYRDLLSGNFSLATELFTCVGGFDSAFNTTARDDYELGARLISRGASFVFAADALGYHYDNTDLDRSCKRKRREGAADVLFGRRHPELRPTLPLAGLDARWSRLSRVLRTMAFHWPNAGDALAGQLRTVLDILERLRLRRRWRGLLSVVLDYWYWRGVAEAVGTPRALAHLLQGGPVRADVGGAEIDIDLREGIDVAERRLDEMRPCGARLRFGQHPIGFIAPRMGAERLRASHLRPLLGRDYALPLLVASALDGARGRAAEPNRPGAAP